MPFVLGICFQEIKFPIQFRKIISRRHFDINSHMALSTVCGERSGRKKPARCRWFSSNKNLSWDKILQRYLYICNNLCYITCLFPYEKHSNSRCIEFGAWKMFFLLKNGFIQAIFIASSRKPLACCLQYVPCCRMNLNVATFFPSLLHPSGEGEKPRT